MRSLSKLLCVALVGAAITTFGCGGQNKKPQQGPTGDTPTSTASTLPADLMPSVQALARDVRSSRSEFNWHISRPGFDIGGGGSYAFQAPDGLYLRENYTGQGTVPSAFNEHNESELLVLGQQIYLRTPAIGVDWVLFSPQAFGKDWDVAQRLLSAKSPLSYQAVVAGSSQILDLGLQGLTGGRYEHYRTMIDAGTLMAAFANAYGRQGQPLLANRFSGQVTLDIWVDPSTLLPHEVTAHGKIPYLGDPTDLTLNVNFSEYNGSSVLPATPAHARPIAQLATP